MPGNDNKLDGTIDIDRVADVMSNALTGYATRSGRNVLLTTQRMAKVAIQVLAIFLLWYQFSYGSEGSTRGQVMSIDCNLVRPFAWLLRRHTVKCADDDWVCAAGGKEVCGISFIMAAALCNAAISLLVDLLTSINWR